MKIDYMSDLHLEKSPLRLQKPTSDVLILAGDIYHVSLFDYNISGFFEDISKKYKHVIYVPGNHEYYDSDINIIESLRTFCNSYKNIYLLDNQTKIIDGVQFIGGTGWTHFNNLDAGTMKQASRTINDYRRIRNGNEMLSIYDIIEKHAEYVNFFKSVDKSKYINIAISHHSPTYLTTAKSKIGDNFEIQGCYCSDMLQYMDGIKYWIHGHLHDSVDIDYNDCKVRSNSRGYKFEDCFDIFNVRTIEV
jgi:DNA repair exonuclease SbcCD nuclease subunit